MEVPRHYFYRNACSNATTQKWVYLYFMLFTLRFCMKMSVWCISALWELCAQAHYTNSVIVRMHSKSFNSGL